MHFEARRQPSTTGVSAMARHTAVWQAQPKSTVHRCGDDHGRARAVSGNQASSWRGLRRPHCSSTPETWQPVAKVSASPFGRILARLRRRRCYETDAAAEMGIKVTMPPITTSSLVSFISWGGPQAPGDSLEYLEYSALRCSLHPGRIHPERLGPPFATGC